MVKKLVLLAVALSTVLAAIPVMAATRPTDVAVSASYQDDSAQESTESEAIVADPVGPLAPGERFNADAFAIEIQAVDVSTSLVRTDYVEVRVAVAYQNNSAAPIPYSPTAFAGEYTYPRLELVDGEGIAYPLNRRIADHTVAGSDVPSIPVGLPGHWTVGYQIPATQSSPMSIRLVDGGNVTATWDLEAGPVALAGWDAPDGASVVNIGQEIEWSDGLTIDFHTVYGDACGDPYTVVSAGNGTVFGTVTSSATADTLFPNVLYPNIPFYAVWADGSSARYQGVDEADSLFKDLSSVSAGTADAFDPFEEESVLFDIGLNNRESDERVILAPGTTHSFAVEFTVPRDSRLVDPQADPVAMYTVTPSGTGYWVDLAGAQSFDTEFVFGDSVDLDSLTAAEIQFLDEIVESFACDQASPTRYLGTLDGVATYSLFENIPTPVAEENF